MISKNFRLNIIVRVGLLTLLAVVLAFVLTSKPSLFIPLVLSGLLIAVAINLVHYIERSTRDLTHFLLSLRQGGYTEHFTTTQEGRRFRDLSQAFNDIINEFSRINLERELQFQYLQTLNEHIGIGIFSFDGDGKLISMNPAAKSFISLSSFNHLDDFKKIDHRLYHHLTAMSGDQRIVVSTTLRNEPMQIGVSLKELAILGKPTKIFLIQNLNQEMETKEIEAWQQLIRVLTHEIMNSVTPIASLSAAMKTILSNKTSDQLTAENIDDLKSSIDTVVSRSNGLLRFVSAYKQYAKSIDLKIESFDLIASIEKIIQLLGSEAQDRHISIALAGKTDHFEARGDVALLEQVVINILKNAIEATPEGGHISIHLTQLNGKTRLQIVDNGKGIEAEIMEKIFVPFFTTKRNGSGIGLSFSRQVIRAHGGSIKVTSKAGEGTTFSIEW